MPTGSGKTYLSETAIAQALAAGRRAIYLAPLRALAAELYARWSDTFAPHAVGIFTGEYGAQAEADYPVTFEAARLLIMTPERLEACTRDWHAHWGWIPEVDLVVADELHLLGDGHRGATLESALTRLRRLNPLARVWGLSATLGNVEELAGWLGAKSFQSTWRPVPLNWTVLRYAQASDKPRLCREAVARNVAAGGASLVFVQSRRRAESVALALAEADLRAAAHHAGLSRARRTEVEDAFRADALDVVVCTPTLEMGLNLPARQVVLYDLQVFDGSRNVPLSAISVWQRAGRAGRPGLDETGEAVLLAAEWQAAAASYLEGRFEPITSRLADPARLAEYLLAEVASGLARTPGQLEHSLAATLAGFQGRAPDVRPALAEMVRAGMLVEQAGEDGARPRLSATRLGRIATRHLLSPVAVIFIQQALAECGLPTILDLLVIACGGPDVEPLPTVDFDELADLAARARQEPSRLLATPWARLRQLGGLDARRLPAALKAALALRGLTRGLGPAAAAAELNLYDSELERLREEACRRLAAIVDLLGAGVEAQAEPSVRDPEMIDPLRRAEAVLHMVAAGLDEQAATLTLVSGIGPAWARRLLSAGLRDIEDLAAADPAALAELPGLSPRRAGEWVEAAARLLPEASAYYFRDEAPAAVVTAQAWPEGIDPYRLGRALELVVEPAAWGYMVSGGSEPHRVLRVPAGFRCDCPDTAAICKHVLAIRLAEGDVAALTAARRLTPEQGGGLDLFALWLGARQARADARSAPDLIAGPVQLVADVVSIDDGGGYLARWARLDHLLMLALSAGERLPAGRMSKTLDGRVSKWFAAQVEGGWIWPEYVVAGRGEEVLGSLGVAQGARGVQADARARLARAGLVSAAVAELLAGRPLAEVAAAWHSPALQTDARGWLVLLAWQAGRVARALDDYDWAGHLAGLGKPDDGQTLARLRQLADDLRALRQALLLKAQEVADEQDD